MSKYITTYSKGTEERNRLEKMASYLNEQLNELTGWTVKVKDTYFDYGQNWMWTTLIVYEGTPDESYQMLYPVQMEKLQTVTTDSIQWEQLSHELVGSVLNMYNKSYRKKDSIANHLKRYDYDATLGKTVFRRTVLFNDLTISEKEVKKIIEDNMEDYTDSIICISRKQADCFCKTK